MKKLIFLIVFVLLNLYLWSQNSNLDFKYAIKLYNLTTFEDNSKTGVDTSSWNTYNYTDKTLQVLHPAIAFQWKTNKNDFHEIELTSFRLDKVETGTENQSDTINMNKMISGGEIITTAISVRYEYILNFNKSNDSKFVPSLGFSISPYYRQINRMPYVSNEYMTSEKYIGTRAFVVPRLTYYFLSKFFIDLNIPICISDIYFLSDKNEDPTLTIDQRTINTFDFEAFPKFLSGRIGVGVKL
jgi:hypothetical protein